VKQCNKRTQQCTEETEWWTEQVKQCNKRAQQCTEEAKWWTEEAERTYEIQKTK